MQPPIPKPASVPEARARSVSRGRAEDPAKVVGAFNTWAFKREQPSDPALLHDAVSRRIAARLPVEFVLYWGKGPRNVIAHPEVDCLDYLAALGRRVADVYPPGACIRLIFTDTHARLNGHSQAAMMSYFLSVGDAARQRGLNWCLLGDLTHHQQSKFASSCPAARPEGTIRQLERSAARWYNGSGRPLDGAIAYYDMNMIEKRAVELEFPDAVFITFSGGELRDLFPDRLPVFYMYSVRKGVSVKPWFIDEAATPAARAAT